MKKHHERSTLIFHEKLSLNSGLIVERKIWRIVLSEHYPLGIKYRLVLANPKSHEVVLLYDNHWPKGPHVHWSSKERTYKFVSVEMLLKDFIQESAVEEKRYHEDKKNHY